MSHITTDDSHGFMEAVESHVLRMKQPVSQTFRCYSSNWEPFCMPRTVLKLLPKNFSDPPTAPIRHAPPSVLSYRWESGRLETRIDPRQSCQMTGRSRLPDHWATLYAITYNASTLTSQNERLCHNRFPIHIQQPGDRELLAFEILIFNISPQPTPGPIPRFPSTRPPLYEVLWLFGLLPWDALYFSF